MKDKNLHIVLGLLSNTCRFLLAAAFIFSGFIKAVDPLGFQYKIEEFLALTDCQAWLPDFLPLLAAVFLCSLEFSIGVCLLFGIRRRSAALGALILMLFMTPLTAYLAIYNPLPDCGCFGDAWVLSNGESFAKNLVLLLAASIVWWGRDRLIAFVTPQLEWLVSLYTLLFVLSLSFYCIDHLPVLDFRPYKIGRSIPEGMRIPEGAQPNVYETFFTLEKNGERREFTLEEYPDSTWTFIDARTVLKRKGYEPPIHDFSMVEVVSGEDITDEVLADEGYTFLLVAHRLEEADDSHIDLINEVYDYAVEHGYRFYCLTASPEEQMELWQDKTGAEYPFCRTDAIALKTIIRANPGLVLLKGGTVLNKWNSKDIPDEYMLTDRLEQLPIASLNERHTAQVVGYVCLWFFIPLLIVVGIDLLFVRRQEWKAARRMAQIAETPSEEAQTQD